MNDELVAPAEQVEEKPVNPFLKALGDNLKGQMSGKSLTPKALGELSDLSAQTIRGIQKGSRDVNFLTIVQLAAGLNVTIADLISGLPDPAVTLKKPWTAPRLPETTLAEDAQEKALVETLVEVVQQPIVHPTDTVSTDLMVDEFLDTLLNQQGEVSNEPAQSTASGPKASGQAPVVAGTITTLV